jgi:hypothetical protein
MSLNIRTNARGSIDRRRALQQFRLVDLTSLKPVPYSVVIPGAIIVTPVGKDYQLHIEGTGVRAALVKAIQLTSQQSIGTGSTVVRVSKEVKGGSTSDSIALTLAASALNGRATGSFDVLPGATIYVFCESSAGHQDVSIQVIVWN